MGFYPSGAHTFAVKCGHWGLKSLMEEVTNYRVLCANHHQKHTIQRFGYRKWLAED